MFIKIIKKSSGHSLVEVVLSAAVLTILGTVFTYAIIYGRETNLLAGQHGRAVLLAREGIEIVNNIRDDNFTSIIDGSYGLLLNNNLWEFTENIEEVENFNRQVIVSTIDVNTKQVEVLVNWQQNQQRTGTVSLKTYLTNWKAN